MTKPQKISLAVLSLLISSYLFYRFTEGKSGFLAGSIRHDPSLLKNAQMGQNPPFSFVPVNPQKKSPAKAIISTATPWKKNLEKTLFTQGKGKLKKVDIEKIDSFPWKMGKVDIHVDSVIVKMEDFKGHRSSFRAIVDSTTGKILQTWDHPVIDNFNSQNRVGIKIDPRYHND